MHSNVYCSPVCNSQGVEAMYMSIDKEMDKEDVYIYIYIYICNEMILVRFSFILQKP